MMTLAFSTTRRKDRKASSGSSISSRKQRSILFTVITGRMRSPRACTAQCPKGVHSRHRHVRQRGNRVRCPRESRTRCLLPARRSLPSASRPSDSHPCLRPPPRRTWRSTVSVCTHTPSMQSTTTRAPSVMRSAAVTSDEKSTWPAQGRGLRDGVGWGQAGPGSSSGRRQCNPGARKEAKRGGKAAAGRSPGESIRLTRKSLPWRSLVKPLRAASSIW